MKVHDWKPYEKNTLRGFFTLEFSTGLCIKDCTLHEKNGEQWVSFPGVPYQDKDGKQTYRNIIFFEDKARMEALKRKVLPLLAELRGQPASTTPQANDSLPF